MQLRCPPTVGNQCRGLLRTERGETTLDRETFRITAGQYRNVTMRLSRQEYRRLVRRGSQRVLVTVLARDDAQTLHRATARLTLRPAG